VKIAFFVHSVTSDWNNGNAHFQRGLASELARLGHGVRIFEAEHAWSLDNLRRDRPEAAVRLERYYPELEIERYEPAELDLERALDGFELVVVHEWNEPALVRAIADLRVRSSWLRVLFHDTHHRSASDAHALEQFGVTAFDGVLAFGEAVRERYLRAGWNRRVWTFHEAADTHSFKPIPELAASEDLVWVGNFGDDERTRELDEFLLRPARVLGLRGSVYGVRYPPNGVEAVRASGLCYRGWLPNYQVPEVFARARATVHVPRRPYAHALPGIPTIRVFEALACGIPLVSAPWSDSEGLFRADDFLRARDGAEMTRALKMLLEEPQTAEAFAGRGLETVLRRHTCRHRAEQLLGIARELRRAESEPVHETVSTSTRSADGL